MHFKEVTYVSTTALAYQSYLQFLKSFSASRLEGGHDLWVSLLGYSGTWKPDQRDGMNFLAGVGLAGMVPSSGEDLMIKLGHQSKLILVSR